VEEELLRLGWAMEQGVATDCDEEEEAMICEEEDVADVKTMEEELGMMTFDQVGRGSYTL